MGLSLEVISCDHLLVHLEGTNGTALTFRIDGYEFPDNEDGSWDSNWLQVSGSMTAEEGAWDFAGPRLTTRDAATVAPWLAGIVRGRVPAVPDPVDNYAEQEIDHRGLLDFMEPFVAFSLKCRSDEAARLRVHFSHDGLPPWYEPPEHQRWGRYDFFVTMDIPLGRLRSAAGEWHAEAARFPRR